MRVKSVTTEISIRIEEISETYVQNTLQRAEIFVKQMTELAFFLMKCCLISSIFYAKSCQKIQNKAYTQLSYEICLEKKRNPKRALWLNLFKSMSDKNHTLFLWTSLDIIEVKWN